MTKSIIWVHADCLNPQSQPYLENSEAPALFVFDEVVLEGYQITLKRLVFIYECLLDMQVEIRRGEVADEVLAFAARYGAERVVTSWTPSPRFHTIVEQISAALPVEIVHERPLCAKPGPFDLGRFSRFWKQAERTTFLLPERVPGVPAQTLTIPGIE